MATHETKSELSIAIIGAGIGGVAAAIALQQQGIRAELYEQATHLREVGAAVVIHPPSVRLFQQWGIADRFAQEATRIYWVQTAQATDGKLLKKEALPTQTNDPGEGWADITHRADLYSLLLSQLPPASIHLGRKCQTVIDHEDHAEIRFVDGSSVRASLVIGADGIHSVVRPLISSDTPVYSGYHAYRGTVSREGALGLIPEGVLTYWVDPGRVMLLLPMRAGKSVSVDVILPSTDSLGESWSTTVGMEDVIEKLAGFKAELLQMVRNIDGPIGARALFDRAPIEHWSAGHITLLGDAAHPMLPAQGQGANMAIEDGVALADVLRGVDVKGIPEALQRYEGRRKPRATLYQEKSREFVSRG